MAAKALAWAQPIPNGCTVETMVVSDYIELGTTEGYNHISYYNYEAAKAFNLTPGGTFTELASCPDGPGMNSGILAQTLTAETITFDEHPTIDDFWYNNSSHCAVDYTEYDITRSGYNGKYNQPSSK